MLVANTLVVQPDRKLAKQRLRHDIMEILYFAYGSNLCLRRMRGRVPSAKRIVAAVLPGYELRWHKRGVDGSGKCSIAIAPRDPVGVYGILYRLAATEKSQLDVTEGLGSGYDAASVTVETPAGLRQVTTYLAAHSHIDDRLLPYSWYRDLVIEGASEAGIPDDYVRRLATVPTQPDPDEDREAHNRAAIPCQEPDD